MSLPTPSPRSRHPQSVPHAHTETQAAAPTEQDGAATDEPEHARRLAPGSMLGAAQGALGAAQLARRIQRRRHGRPHAAAAVHPHPRGSEEQHAGPRAEVIEPKVIEQRPASRAEQNRFREHAIAAEHAEAERRVQAEHADGDRREQAEKVGGVVKSTIVARIGEAGRALEQGIDAFKTVTMANPTLERATPESLGGFAGAVWEWVKASALGGIDRCLGMPEGVRVTRAAPTAEGDAPAAPEREVRAVPRAVFDKAGDKLLGGAVDTKDGALLPGTVGGAVGATAVIGDFLERTHREGMKKEGQRNIHTVCGRLRRQFDWAADELTANVKLASPAQVDAIAARLDITRPLFSAGEVSDRLHVLFLESMQRVLSVNDYLDAAHSLGARLSASRADIYRSVEGASGSAAGGAEGDDQ